MGYVLLAIVDKSEKIWKLLSSRNYIDLEEIAEYILLIERKTVFQSCTGGNVF
jgi:hypothetical protein